MPSRSDDRDVTCPACGVVLHRDEAREYDRFGNRWERAGKTFEYLCKPCHRQLCHLPRGDLEETLVAVGSHHADPAAFLAAYYREVGADRQSHH